MTPDIATIDADRAAMELRLTWTDGVGGSLGLVAIRLACPCAGCRSARDQGREPWPEPNSPTPLALTSAELVGAWGRGITWNDGHSTGIYPFEALRRWVESGTVALPPDSGLGQTS